MVVWRCAQYHPSLVSHAFVAATPYAPPARELTTLEQTVQKIPIFGYQLQLAGPELESEVKSKSQIRDFLSALFGGQTRDGGGAFVPEKGVLLEKLEGIGKSPFLSKEVS